MDFKQRYRLWCDNEYFDTATRMELKSISDEKEIEERFYCDLKFGTGGMRGIMGAGTNRLNKYTVGRVTVGLGNYLIDNFNDKECKNRGIAIAYDTRNNSRQFAEAAADILSGMGFKIFIFDKPVPTPELSYIIRHLNCIAGIVITASHNPKEYNGYKVYDENGGQLVVWQAKHLVEYVNNIKDYTSISFNGNDEFKEYIDTTEEFTDAVVESVIHSDIKIKDELRIVYTALHGTGNIPVRKALEKSGFKNVYIVKEQEQPDGYFSTVKSPNPEVKSSLDMALKLGAEKNADIVMGTDPDCDRVGVGVKQSDGEYQLLTGNQIGALIADYVITHTNLSNIKKPAIIKTVVTSDLGAEVAKAHGFKVFETLTGFKFIGEKITQFERAKRECDASRDYDFVVGYEESFGYLAGTYVRDKDGVGSCLLICEMAAEYKKSGYTLLDRLNQLYSEYGYHYDAQDSFTLKGKAGAEKIAAIMAELNCGQSLLEGTTKIIDYNLPVKAEDGFGMLPASNVIKYVLEDGSWIAVRPSGTEAKIKIYYNVIGINEDEAKSRYKIYQKIVKSKLGL